mmetsp:Transcript_63020/g.149300  ORF Transcript_63020/g.149300 Transcript_63020/m.149300 type:complete len:209 (+) Transcript_63020:2-628(+)
MFIATIFFFLLSIWIAAFGLFGMPLVDVPTVLHPSLPPVVPLLSLSNASLISSELQIFAFRIVYHFAWVPTGLVRNNTAQELIISALNTHPPPYLHSSKLVLDVRGDGATCELNGTVFEQCLTCSTSWPSDTMEGVFCEDSERILAKAFAGLCSYLASGVTVCVALFFRMRGRQPLDTKLKVFTWLFSWFVLILIPFLLFLSLLIWSW